MWCRSFAGSFVNFATQAQRAKREAAAQERQKPEEEQPKSQAPANTVRIHMLPLYSVCFYHSGGAVGWIMKPSPLDAATLSLFLIFSFSSKRTCRGMSSERLACDQIMSDTRAGECYHVSLTLLGGIWSSLLWLWFAS